MQYNATSAGSRRDAGLHKKARCGKQVSYRNVQPGSSLYEHAHVDDEAGQSDTLLGGPWHRHLQHMHNLFSESTFKCCSACKPTWQRNTLQPPNSHSQRIEHTLRLTQKLTMILSNPKLSLTVH